MQMKLELVPIPVTDIDRAIAFYVEKLDFHVDHDTKVGEAVRIVQLTPQSSACSILFSKGLGEISEIAPGSMKGVHLVVKSVSETRADLVSRGVECAAITDHGRGVKSFGISDPDGNSWVVQEMEWRSPDFD